MDEFDPTDLEAILNQIRQQASTENYRVTQHAQQEMVEEDVLLDELLEAIASGQIVENYPHHQRGACCLISGFSQTRPLHIVCTTSQPTLIIITVYEPKPPKWATPTERRR